MRTAFRAYAPAAVLLLLAACAPYPPHRAVLADLPGDCARVYDAAKDSGKAAEIIRKDLDDPARSRCWLSATEKHRRYDLLTVEFDDQGWLARREYGPLARNDQLRSMIARLSELTDVKKQPLSIVVYVHGWHHSARPDDDNVIRFRELLDEMALLEASLCLQKRGDAKASGACAEGESADPREKRRHVVGIYVSWRGDSIVGPVIEHASVWDRKLAAEKVSTGSVHELFALLHDFYARHGCHSADLTGCGDVADVRMLTVGHSFGGLITYRALAPRLVTTISEQYRPGARDPSVIPYVYSYGDMTVLINPAFEGTRFEVLAQAARNREYELATRGGERTAQLPILIVAQSKGDVATRFAFPAFRWFTTAFESVNGPQSEGNINTVGWTARYKTHDLVPDPAGDACGDAQGSLVLKLVHENEWITRMRKEFYRGFHGDVRLCEGLVLNVAEDGTGNPAPKVPFTPLWVVQADKRIIADHNDFLNPRLLDFVRQMYFAVLREQDAYVAKAAKR